MKSAPEGHVGVFAGHQAVGDFFVLVHIEQHDGRAQRNPVARNLVEIHQRQVGQSLLELAQPHSHEVLPFAGSRVVGILAEIAQSGGKLQRLRQFVAEFVLQGVDFFFELFSWVCRLIEAPCNLMFLEQPELDGQVLLGILPDIVHQLLNLGCRLVQAVEQASDP